MIQPSAHAPRVSYRQSYRRCGKASCRTCRDGRGHGPYWYASWREGSRVRTSYVGKTLPGDQPRWEGSIVTLGRFEVSIAGRGPIRCTPRTRDLFTMLLSAPTGRLPREEVAGTLWPEFDPLRAHQNLRTAVSSLRRLLAHSQWVRIEGPSVRLDMPSVRRDDVVFAEAAVAALERPSFDVVARAIGAYGGEFLPDDRYSDWTIYRRQELATLRRRLVLEAARLAQSKTEMESAAGWVRNVLAGDPADEPLARAAMRLYHRSGRRTEALRVYARLERALADELEVEPEPETQNLRAEVVKGPSSGEVSA